MDEISCSASSYEELIVQVVMLIITLFIGFIVNKIKSKHDHTNKMMFENQDLIKKNTKRLESHSKKLDLHTDII